MNYLKELNAFYDWLESNPCPSDAIALWHALMSICNKAGWLKEFTVANPTLQTKAGLSRQKLDRWRNFLEQKELIVYTKSKRVNEAGRYKINSFYPSIVQNDTQDDTQDSTQNDTQDSAQNAHIIKLNKTKLKNICADCFDELWNVYPKKVGRAKAQDHWNKKIAPMLEKGKIHFDQILQGTRNYLAYCKKNNRYLKDGSAFVSQQTWNDFLEIPLDQEVKTNRVTPELELVTVTEKEGEFLDDVYRKQAEANRGS